MVTAGACGGVAAGVSRGTSPLESLVGAGVFVGRGDWVNVKVGALTRISHLSSSDDLMYNVELIFVPLCDMILA